MKFSNYSLIPLNIEHFNYTRDINFDFGNVITWTRKESKLNKKIDLNGFDKDRIIN
ncbi:hypothetical protein [Spiroplasma tabanidicola]|uniref:hypothetical protein n=1 Tax=Spiroplasma tabanidicola TaxID=324079 RepID=UPI0012DD0CEE|nr:hypothetical protein [Spiroplasma tabanidicola]